MSEYKTMSGDQLEEIFSRFLIDSWSYSKVTQFARHEKAFEMLYIYNYKSKSSATTVAGQAYHAALEAYFKGLQDGKEIDLVDLEGIAFNAIDKVGANLWKLQKTTPTVNDCIMKAIATANALLKNFMAEKSVYEFSKIIDVECYCDEFITVNGVDVPLPIHAKIDLILETTEGKIAIVDHKSKGAFSSEEELKLSIGIQAISYVLAYESKTGLTADEVWFVENKYSTNRDNSPQLSCFKVTITPDTRKLYEALLYEPLKRMLAACFDPDYVFLINESDNYIDLAEIYDFWAKTQISEVEDFDIAESKKALIGKRLKKIKDSSLSSINPKVIKNFRENANTFIKYDLSDKDMTEKEKIEHVLRSFGQMVEVAHIFDGYSSNTYLLSIGAGTKVQQIHSHKLDIANALNVSNVRICKDLVVYDGKSYLSIEFSKQRSKDLNFNPADLTAMKIPIGKDNFENVIYWDLDNQSTPHMLVCGATGSGKSVMIRSTIEYMKLAGVTEIILLDPKYEFTSLKSDPSISVFNEILEIEEQMEFMVMDMNERVKYNQSKKTAIIFDEFADAVSQSRKGKELDVFKMEITGINSKGQPKREKVLSHTLKSLEQNLQILLQKGRSSGFRIVSATQRASTKIINGDAKVNFPVQVCFSVPKAIDSNVVIGEHGAELLAGKGDGLMKSPEYKDIVRFQAYYFA